MSCLINVSAERVTTHGSGFFGFEVLEESLGLLPVLLLVAVITRSRDVRLVFTLVFTHFVETFFFFGADLNRLLVRHKR